MKSNLVLKRKFTPLVIMNDGDFVLSFTCSKCGKDIDVVLDRFFDYDAKTDSLKPHTPLGHDCLTGTDYFNKKIKLSD